MKKLIFIWVTVFAVTMGIFEGSVVVYLRALYYLDGFSFPLQLMENQLAITELIRELASLFMLLSVGILAGKTLAQRFGWFLFSFAVWDIIYYVFLYLILGWPESLFTWDILFLLPIAWTGPVITPILISILMIILGLLLNRFQIRITKKDWFILIVGSLIVFASFIWDFSRFLIQNISSSEFKHKTFADKLIDLSVKYIPESFPWFVFIIGFTVILAGIYMIYLNRNINSSIE